MRQAAGKAAARAAYHDALKRKYEQAAADGRSAWNPTRHSLHRRDDSSTVCAEITLRPDFDDEPLAGAADPLGGGGEYFLIAPTQHPFIQLPHLPVDGGRDFHLELPRRIGRARNAPVSASSLSQLGPFRAYLGCSMSQKLATSGLRFRRSPRERLAETWPR